MKKEKVLKYLKEIDCTPLKFAGVTEKKEEELKELPLNELATEVLKLVQKYASENQDGIVETGSGRHRSVEDLWRHIKYFKPETSIFEVMETLSNFGDEVSSLMCGGIHRMTIYLTPRDSAPFKSMSFDEFGLQFSDWKNISKEE